MIADFHRRALLLGIPELDEDGFRPRGRNGGMCLYGGGKGGGGDAPSPDPAIGQAALKNVELGNDWLDFAKEQFEIGNGRQQKTDNLNTQVIQQQLSDQQKSAQRSDQQWSDYNSIYRPIERQNALDAIGAQYLTDDQVKELIGKQNTTQANQLKSQYDANIAAINGLSKTSTSTTQGGNLDKASATSLVDNILGPAPSAYYKRGTTGIPAVGIHLGTNTTRVDNSAAVAEYNTKRDALIKQFMGLGNDGTTTTTNFTDAERQAMIDAETKRYEASVAGLGDVTDQVMMQREAQRNAEGNAAATAKADVLANANAQTQSGIRQMAAMGVNPNSGRFAGIQRTQDTNTALAAAGAQNNARTTVKNQGIALRADQANYGRGGTAVAAQQVGLGTNSGNSAVQNNASGNANFYANNGIMTSGYGGAVQANTNAGNMLTNLYGNQLSAWNAQQQANATSSAGLGSMIGSLAGAGATMY